MWKLNLLLKTRKVSFFQLRLKNYTLKEKILIGKKVKNICKKNKVKFLINDNPFLTLKHWKFNYISFNQGICLIFCCHAFNLFSWKRSNALSADSTGGEAF